jgi:subtilisin
MSERIRNLIAVMVSAAVLSLAGIIALNFLGATPAKAEEGAGTLSERGAQADEQQQTPSSSGLLQKAEREGSVRVIVGLSTDFMPEGRLSRAEVADQRDAVQSAQAGLQEDLQGTGYQTLRQYDTIPYIALNVSSRALQELQRSPRVTGIMEDRLAEVSQDAPEDLDSPALAESTPLVQAPTMWANGFTGSGQVVAVLDTGVDSAHPFSAGKVVEEACFTSNRVAGSGNCPNGTSTQTGAGSGVPCTYAPGAYRHGTHVAGIAAGQGSSFSGVAKGANVMSVQVFSRFTRSNCSGAGEDPCALSWTSD